MCTVSTLSQIMHMAMDNLGLEGAALKKLLNH